MKHNIINLFIILIVCTNVIQADSKDFLKELKIEESKIEFPNVESLTINENTEVLFLENNGIPIQSIQIHFYFGTKNLKEKLESIALLLNLWEISGSKEYPNEKLREELDLYGIRFGLEESYEKIILNYSYLSMYQKKSIELLENILHKSVFLNGDLDYVKSQLKENILRRNDSVNSISSRKFTEFLFKNTNRGYSYQLDSLEKINLEDIKNLYSLLTTSVKRRILFTGDLNSNDVASVFKNLFQEDKKVTIYEEPKIDEQKLKDLFENTSYKNLLIEKDFTQTVLLKLCILPPHNHPDFYALQVLNFIIGGSGASSILYNEIRTKRGLAYVVYSRNDFDVYFGSYLAFVSTKNETAVDTYKLLQKIISPETIQNISIEEIQSAIRSINNRFIFLFSNEMDILENYLRFKEHNMPDNYVEIFQENIKKVTKEDLVRVGDKYFKEDRFKYLFIGPKSKIIGKIPDLKHISPEERIP